MDAFVILNGVSFDILVGRYYKNASNEQWARALAAVLRERSAEEFYREPVVVLESRVHVILQRNDVYFVAITKQDYPTLLLIEVLEQCVSNLAQRLTTDAEALGSAVIQEHYATVVILIDEMLDFGLPGLLEPNALALLVPPKSGGLGSVLQRISPSRLITDFVQTLNGKPAEPLSDTATETVLGQQRWGPAEVPGEWMGSGSGVGAGSGILGCGSALWWRRGGISSPAKEHHVALVETLHCAVAADQILNAYVTGEIQFTSQLPGIPNCRLFLKNLNAFGMLPTMSFHPSVQLDKWKTEQVVAFVPPNGRFVPLNYSLWTPKLVPPLNVTARFIFPDLSNGDPKATPSGALPFGKFEITMVVNKEFRTLCSRFGSHENLILEKVKLAIRIPAWVTSLTSVEPSSGTVKFLSKRHLLTWTFSRFPLDFQRAELQKCGGTLTLNTAVFCSATDNKSVSQPQEKPPNSLGSFESSTPQNNTRRSATPPALLPKDLKPVGCLRFLIHHWTVSGISVDSVDVSGSAAPVKSVRTMTVGDIEYHF